MEEIKNKDSQDEKFSNSQGLLNYKNKGSQTVLRILGIELTAPSGLKNPGIVYISFIVINLFVFFVLKGFITN